MWGRRRGRGVRRSRMVVVAALVTSVAACTTSTPPTTPEPAPTTASPTPLPSWSPGSKDRLPPVPPSWPLTGQVDEIEPRPALSIKVENHAAARPQSGLEEADVVWEELVEGGPTRFNAVYHSVVPDVVGPIRSVRPMDAAISGPYGGLLVFSGGQEPYIDMVRDVGLQLVIDDDEDPGFFRSTDRVIPHNLYGSGADFLDQADDDHSEPPDRQLRFADDLATASAVAGGAAASRLDLSFPSTSPGWEWSPAGDGAWRREEFGLPQSSADGDPLLAVNVVVLRVQVVMTGARDAAGAPVPETILEGEGPALLATGGKVVEGSWAKEGALDPLRLLGEDGEDLLLAPGNTWIELVPVEDGAVSYR